MELISPVTPFSPARSVRSLRPRALIPLSDRFSEIEEYEYSEQELCETDRRKPAAAQTPRSDLNESLDGFGYTFADLSNYAHARQDNQFAVYLERLSDDLLTLDRWLRPGLVGGVVIVALRDITAVSLFDDPMGSGPTTAESLGPEHDHVSGGRLARYFVRDENEAVSGLKRRGHAVRLDV
jgi:hypothetical protein